MTRKPLLAWMLALAALAACPPAAVAQDSEGRFDVRGAPGPGPSTYERTFVHRYGSASARRVLILIPGLNAGSGSFRLVAPEIARRVRDVQVWTWDRRTQPFEDTDVFAQGDPARALAYYLQGQEVDGRRFDPVGAADAPFARDWGLSLQLEDLRRIVQRARAGGRRKVLLGGHSLGASMASAYAAWDFAGRPGYRDIDALVLVDGGPGLRAGIAEGDVRRELESIRGGDPFTDLLGLGLPWAPGVFVEVGGLAARKLPAARSSVTELPAIPPGFRPPVPVTNEAALGYALDATTSPPAFGLFHVRAGRLADAGDPRPWADGENSPIQRVAGLFGTEPDNAVEWYFPRRLLLDVRGLGELGGGSVPRLLGLRTRHRGGIDVPLYAFQTDFRRPQILDGARRLFRRARMPRGVFVDAERFAHVDVLAARPSRNVFLQTVVPFLRRPLGGARRRG